MSYAIAGHHSGLPNDNENETYDLKNRLKKKISEYKKNVDIKCEQPEITNEDCPFQVAPHAGAWPLQKIF